jgi:hypothetical protein
VFNARYAPGPDIKQTRLVFKRLKSGVSAGTAKRETEQKQVMYVERNSEAR